jgi:K(+)-stimulated pyrophosphate-energized sodium pump
VGDPFKDTSSVAMNPIIKFTTLFGLLAVELAVALNNPVDPAHPAVHGGNIEHTTSTTTMLMSIVFFLISATFVWRSFYAMRIKTDEQAH